MDKLLKPGRIIFAVGIIALAGLCIIYKDFILGRPPAWPAGWNFNPELGYISAVLLIISAIGILVNRKAVSGALVIAALVFLLSVLRYLPVFMHNWGGTYKSFGLLGGALIVVGSYKNAAKDYIITGCVLLASFFIASGYAHFKYADFVENFIPAYLPFRMFWTYFCGICLIAGGIGVVVPQTRRLAAFLSGLMIAGWFVFLHIPRFIANTNDPGDRMGLCESFTFVGICLILAAISDRRSVLGKA